MWVQTATVRSATWHRSIVDLLIVDLLIVDPLIVDGPQAAMIVGDMKVIVDCYWRRSVFNGRILIWSSGILISC